MEESGEEKLIAAAKFIMTELKSNKKLSDKVVKILVDLSTQLASLSGITETKAEDRRLSDIKAKLDSIQSRVMAWEANQSKIWDLGPKEYLKLADEARALVEQIERLNPSKGSEEDDLLRKANDVLQTSMAKIEEELKHIIVYNMKNFEPERLSFQRSKDEGVDDFSIVSFGDISADDSIPRDDISRRDAFYIMDLIDPEVIPDLKNIANLMFASNYDKECSQAFISIRKDAFDECLIVLGIENLSKRNVTKMEWDTLNSKIKRWITALRVFVRIYLASEKLLCEQIFGHDTPMSSFCFFESSKDSVLQILSFAEVIVVGPHQPDRLLRIIDMYDALEDLRPDIESLYPDDCGSYLNLRTEFWDIITRVGDYASTTFLEFKNAVGTNRSNADFPRGGIHHLTRNVFSYIKTLIEYSNSLNTLLKNHSEADDQDLPGNQTNFEEDDSISENSYLGFHFRSLMSLLESNLEWKSRVYKEEALRHLFLMNNIHYMAEKAKGLELRRVLGDNWIRQHNWKFQQYAMSYERSTWSSTLNLLRLSSELFSGSVTKALLKKRLQGFYTAFEEIYKSQTGWSIPNTQLREDVRISASMHVIPAYRSFVGRYASYTSIKFKYSGDDLKNYLLDLFEGSPRSLHKK